MAFALGQGMGTLMTSKSFLPLMWTQTLGAINDNLFKGALVAVVTLGLVDTAGASTSTLVNASTALLIVPFFLFSALAGRLADGWDKAKLVRILKAAEILVMSLAAVGFAIGSLPLLYAALFLMGSQSALFGPVKYSALPELVTDGELVSANGWVEASTFLAIIAGNLAGTLLAALPAGSVVAGGVLLVVAVGGYVASRRLPALPAVRKERPRVADLLPWAPVRRARAHSAAFSAVLMLSAFWAVGAIILGLLPEIGADVIGDGLGVRIGLGIGGAGAISALLFAFTIGIAVGAFLAERQSHGQIRLGTVALGALVFASGLWAFAFNVGGHAALGLLIDVTVMGIGGGLMSVPLYSRMQAESPREERSTVVAANNILNALAMVVAVVLVTGMRGAGLTIEGLAFVLAGVMSIWALSLLFRYRLWVLQDVLRVVLRVVYRMKLDGVANIPAKGGAVLVANHVAFHDAIVVGSFAPRPLRFVMDHQMYRRPGMNLFCRMLRVIPIAPEREDPACLAAAYESIDDALAHGELVVIFPEGGITRDGEMAEFRAGIERILKRRAVPVVPCGISGLWGSFFSRAGGSAMSSWPRRCWSRIALRFGEVVPGHLVRRDTLRAEVMRLRERP